MLRLSALVLFVCCLTFATIGCGGSGENKVIVPEATQTDEELAQIDEEREAAMDTDNLAE